MYGQGAMSMAMARTSTSPSSPESFEVEDDFNTPHSACWQMHGQSPPSSTSQPPRAPAPLQKRRRVTRACDECRRKKIKCDGKQPCTHCTVYSYGMASQLPPSCSSCLKFFNSNMLTDLIQTVHTINLQIEEETPPRSILRP